MQRLTPGELRFSLWFGLSRLPRSLLQEMGAADRTKRDAALRLAADRLLERFKGHEVSAPDPAGSP
jgi:hypothetical protein